MHRHLLTSPVVIALLIGVASSQAAGVTSYGLSAGVAYDTNLSNAETATDREEGFIFSTRASVNQRRILKRGVGLQLAGRIEADGNARYGDLSRIGVGGGVTLNLKPVQGYTQPWYALDASIMLSEFSDSSIRDGVNGRLGATVGKRFTQKFNARLGYGFDWRSAFGGRAFDMQGHSVFANASYDVNSALLLYVRYDVRVGDVVSTATPTNKVVNSAEVIEIDDAFGVTSVARAAAVLGPGPGPGPGPGIGVIGGLLNQRFAYRLDAISHQGRIGANYLLGKNMSIDMSARYRSTRGEGGNDYQATLFQATFQYSFF